MSYEIVDHMDNNGLNNRRSNLRLATYSQNAANRRRNKGKADGYKGVYWCKGKAKWRAKICVNQRDIHIGYYDTPDDAHSAYCAAAVKYHGEFANDGQTAIIQAAL